MAISRIKLHKKQAIRAFQVSENSFKINSDPQSLKRIGFLKTSIQVFRQHNRHA